MQLIILQLINCNLNSELGDSASRLSKESAFESTGIDYCFLISSFEFAERVLDSTILVFTDDGICWFYNYFNHQ